jgi:N6-L-threonylcarbamoyladenine synthase
VLGIDTSCDDTAAAIVEDGRHIRSNVVRSQLHMHAPHGGVVPEVASRAHLGDIAAVAADALASAEIRLDDVDAIGVTYGPGLSGSLRVGLGYAKGLALARDLPLVPINHLEGHVYSNWLIPDEDRPIAEPRFPVLVLIVSGGHTELLLMREHCRYTRLGGTRDDAAGEAFDKVGRQLGLGFPGGPAIQLAAGEYREAGDSGATWSGSVPELPRAWLRGTYDFSFSGLKTAVWHLIESMDKTRDGGLDKQRQGSIALAFQDSVVDVLTTKVAAAAQQFHAATICVCGGVASNIALRSSLAGAFSAPLYAPPLNLCVDNGAMIAAAAYYRHTLLGRENEGESPFAVDAVPGLALRADAVTSG